jgi:hypothetical protein
MRIAIMQPGYLPWLGFFELMRKSDTFVLLDDVQYTKKDWRNRNRIRTKEGWMWLTVPVFTKNKRFQLINEVRISYLNDWRKKHLTSIKINYVKARYFREYFPELERIYYEEKWEYIVDLNVKIIKWMAAVFGIKTPILKSSSLNTKGKREDKIINICNRLNATELYDSKAAESILNLDKFIAKGIKLEFQDYLHPVYKQVYEPFIAYMSAIDLLFQYGQKGLNIILSK